jgi:hypothetical protein
MSIGAPIRSGFGRTRCWPAIRAHYAQARMGTKRSGRQQSLLRLHRYCPFGLMMAAERTKPRLPLFFGIMR